MRGLRRADEQGARPDRRLVGLGLHALRAVARAERESGHLRGALSGGLRLRGARPDARLVLFAAGGLDAAVRKELVRDLSLPRADPGSRGPEDVEVEGQRGGAVGRAEHPRRGRLPLVLLHLEAALGRVPLLAGYGGRVGAPVPQAALEHRRVLHPLRERQRTGGRRRAHRPRPLGAVPSGRNGGAGGRADGRLRHHLRGPGYRRLRRRSLQLVRPALPAALLGRRSRGLRHPAPLPGDHGAARGAADALRRGRGV